MLAFVTALLASAPSHALSCALYPSSPLPSQGATGVPLDVVPRVYLPKSLHDGLWLVDEDGNEVPTTVELVENPTRSMLAYLRPDAPLAPNTRYLFTTLDPSNDYDRVGEFSYFTTGDKQTADLGEPAAVVEVVRDRGRDLDGSWDFFDMTIGEGAPASYVVQISDSARFGSVQEVERTASDVLEGTFSIGSGSCTDDVSLRRGERWVRVASVDYAGNVSEFVELGAARGCSNLPGRAGAGLGVLAGLLLVGRRRRLV